MDIYELLNDVRMEEYEKINLSEKEKNDMKKRFYKSFKKGHRKYYTIAACVAVIAVMSQTVFAQTLVSNIIRSISTGHNNFMQIETPTQVEIPDEYKGMFFDKDGNPIVEYKEGMDIYDADGSMIKFSKKGGVNDYIANGSDKTRLVVTDKTQVAEKLNFAPAMPEYLPEGYEFYGAVLYKNEEGEVSGDYLAMYYKNAESEKQFSIHERIINDDTAIEAGTDGEIRETKVKGYKAVVMDDRSIDWEEGGISVSVLAGQSEVSIEELTKVAESTVR